MQSKHTIYALIVGAGLMALPQGAGAEDPSGAVMANTCFSCHGTDGKSAGAMPSIAGKKADYIIKMLTEFRDGKRPSTVMKRIAKGFTDSEIAALAATFSVK